VVASYRSVLGVQGAFRLMSSALIARLPQGMASLSILLLVRDTTHSYTAAGVAVGANAFATAACAPLLGRLIDRFGRDRTLPGFALGQAVMYATLAVAAGAGGHTGVLILLSAAAGALLPPIAPAVRALLRDVFEDRAVRDTAYSLDAVIQEAIWITGPLAVAVVVSLTSPSAAVVSLGVVCLVGTTLFLRSPLQRGTRPRRHDHSRRSALASPELRALLGPVLLSGTALGATEVGLPSLALHAGSRPAAGLLLALWSVGSLAGGLWYGSRVWHTSLTRRYRLLLMMAVVFTAPLIIARSIPEGVIGALLAGLTCAPVFSCMYALVGRTVTPGSETEAFTWVSSALIGGIAAGSAIAGAVIKPGGVSAPFIVACLASSLAAAIAVGSRARVRQLA
jgi:MFS family permease